jgi:glycerol transport system ATP-binding protein
MVEDLGNFKIVTAKLGRHTLKAKLPEDDPVPGDHGWLTFPPDRTRLYADGRLVA